MYDKTNFDIDRIKHFSELKDLGFLDTLFNIEDIKNKTNIINQLISDIKDFNREVQDYIIYNIFDNRCDIDTIKIFPNLIININYVQNHDTVITIHNELKKFISKFLRDNFERKVSYEDNINFIFALLDSEDIEKKTNIINQLISDIKDFNREVQDYIIYNIFDNRCDIDTIKIFPNLIININYVQNHDTVITIHNELKKFISKFLRDNFKYKILNKNDISFIFEKNNTEIEINFVNCDNNDVVKSVEMRIIFNGTIVKEIQFNSEHKLLLSDFNDYIILFNNMYFVQEILKFFNKKTRDNEIEDFLYNNSLLYCDLIYYLKKKINNSNYYFTSIEELIKTAYSNCKEGGITQKLLTNLNKVEVDVLEGNLENNKEKYVLNFIKLDDIDFICYKNNIYEFILDENRHIEFIIQKIILDKYVIDYLLSNFKMTDCQYLDKNIKYSLNEIDNSVINNDNELKKYIRETYYYVIKLDDEVKKYSVDYKKNIVDLINTINFFKNTPDFSEKIINNGSNKTISISNNFDLNENAYISTDCHGDMYAFMVHLLKSGVVKFKENESAFLYYDMETGKAFKNYSDYTLLGRNNKGNVVLIPNLEIKDKIQEKLFILGDVNDRGPFGDFITATLHYLLKQKNGKEKIIFLVGNHEDMIIDNYTTYDYGLIRRRGEYTNLQNLLKDLVENELMTFCYPNGNTICSHTVFETKFLIRAMNVIIDGKIDKNSNNYYFEDYNDKNYFQQIEKYKAKVLKGKLEGDVEFSKEDIINLCDLLNHFYKEFCLNKTNNPLLSFDNIFGSYEGGLLWSRYVDEKTKKLPSGLNFFCGHDPKENKITKKAFDSSMVIGFDTYQSIGCNSKKPHASIGYINKDKKEISQFLVTRNNELSINLVNAAGDFERLCSSKSQGH